MLLTNNRALEHRAIFKLKCLVRTNFGSNDEAYQRCIQGFRLEKSLTKADVKALTMNLQVLVSKILRLREILHYLIVQ